MAQGHRHDVHDARFVVDHEHAQSLGIFSHGHMIDRKARNRVKGKTENREKR
jgi:hypothetical protein